MAAAVAAIGAISILKEIKRVRNALQVAEEGDSFFTRFYFLRSGLAAVVKTFGSGVKHRKLSASDKTNTEERSGQMK